MAFRLFRRSREAQTEHQYGHGPFSVEGHEPITRDGRLTHADESGLYATGPSIIDHVPWGEYLPEHQCILLDDGVSVGAVYEINPVGTEGRPEWRLEEIRNVVENALQDSIPELDSHQWVVQCFCQDDTDLSAYMDSIRGYVRPRAQGTAFTEAWLKEQERHLKNVATEKGLFVDEAVTGAPWRGQIRRTRMVVYRWVEKPYRDPMAPEVLLNQVCDRLTSALKGAGNRAIVQLREEIGQRLEHPLLVSVYPHRVGRRSCTAVHLSGANNRALDILITVTGNTLWPTEGDYRTGIRWNICVPDATDMLWVLKEIDRATEADMCH